MLHSLRRWVTHCEQWTTSGICQKFTETHFTVRQIQYLISIFRIPPHTQIIWQRQSSANPYPGHVFVRSGPQHHPIIPQIEFTRGWGMRMKVFDRETDVGRCSVCAISFVHFSQAAAARTQSLCGHAGSRCETFSDFSTSASTMCKYFPMHSKAVGRFRFAFLRAIWLVEFCCRTQHQSEFKMKINFISSHFRRTHQIT